MVPDRLIGGTMAIKFLKQDQLPAFLGSLAEKARVVAPVKTDGVVQFQPWTEGTDVELDVLAILAREAVDAVLVAEGLERLHHERERLLLDVDHPAAFLVALQQGRAQAPDLAAVVVGRGRFFRLPLRVGHGLPHRGREIDEKGRGDLAARAIVAHVDALAR